MRTTIKFAALLAGVVGAAPALGQGVAFDPGLARPLVGMLQQARQGCAAGDPTACQLARMAEAAILQLAQAQQACAAGNPAACQAVEQARAMLAQATRQMPRGGLGAPPGGFGAERLPALPEGPGAGHGRTDCSDARRRYEECMHEARTMLRGSPNADGTSTPRFSTGTSMLQLCARMVQGC